MTWETREEPILQAIRQIEEDEGRYVRDRGELAERIDLDERTVALGLQALQDEHFIAGADAATFGGGPGADLTEIRLLGRGRRAAGQWPPEEAVAALHRAIEVQLAQTEDEDEQRTLRRFREFLGSAESAVVIGEAVGRVAAILTSLS